MTTRFEPLDPNTGQHAVELGPGATPLNQDGLADEPLHRYGPGTAWAGGSITPAAVGFLAGVLAAVAVVYFAVLLGHAKYVEDQITVLPPRVAYCDTATLPDPGPANGSNLIRSGP